jgi:hypothetical protein
MPTARKSPVTVLESTRPGGDSTGAGAEREGGFDPQPKAEIAQGEYAYKGAREGAGHWHDTHTPSSRGVARGGAKDPTDDPAELDVLF